MNDLLNKKHFYFSSNIAFVLVLFFALQGVLISSSDSSSNFGKSLTRLGKWKDIYFHYFNILLQIICSNGNKLNLKTKSNISQPLSTFSDWYSKVSCS